MATIVVYGVPDGTPNVAKFKAELEKCSTIIPEPYKDMENFDVMFLPECSWNNKPKRLVLFVHGVAQLRRRFRASHRRLVSALGVTAFSFAHTNLPEYNMVQIVPQDMFNDECLSLPVSVDATDRHMPQ
jgi:hypothetical protein